MTIYSNNQMVEVSHIVEINKQLKKLGSKVKDDLLDGEKTQFIEYIKFSMWWWNLWYYSR